MLPVWLYCASANWCFLVPGCGWVLLSTPKEGSACLTPGVSAAASPFSRAGCLPSLCLCQGHCWAAARWAVLCCTWGLWLSSSFWSAKRAQCGHQGYSRHLLCSQPSPALAISYWLWHTNISLLLQGIFDGKCLCTPSLAIKLMCFVPTTAKEKSRKNKRQFLLSPALLVDSHLP